MTAGPAAAPAGPSRCWSARAALSGLSVQAQGATGISAWPTAGSGSAASPSSNSNHHGPGGGGGGGVIVLTSAAGSMNVAGGTYGTTTTDLSIYGAVSGNPGVIILLPNGQPPARTPATQPPPTWR